MNICSKLLLTPLCYFMLSCSHPILFIDMQLSQYVRLYVVTRTEDIQ